MKARLPVYVSVVLAAVALVLGSTAGTRACPFCSAPTLTLSEQFSKSDAAVLVQWVGGQSPEKDKAGTTTYEILQVVRDPNVTKSAPSTAKTDDAKDSKSAGASKGAKPLAKGEQIVLDRYRAGKKGDLSLLMGTKGEIIEWSNPLEVTETSFNYIVQAPPPESSGTKRLEYFMKFLEYPDQNIANDAYAEFANAPYKDIVPVAPRMPHDKLRTWIVSKDVSPTRLGLYGLMLGLCGDPSDAGVMEKKITEQTEDYRLGIDGVIGGYLLLTGDKGLELVEKSKLMDKKVPFSETYAAMQALRFMWSYGNNKISHDRLRASMRLLLDRPELTDLVITDLARWKDWSIQKRLMEIYGAKEYDVPSIRRAVVRYMIASTKDTPAGSGEKAAPHVQEGAQYLEQLRKKDPKMVSEVERYFLLQ